MFRQKLEENFNLPTATVLKADKTYNLLHKFQFHSQHIYFSALIAWFVRQVKT